MWRPASSRTAAAWLIPAIPVVLVAALAVMVGSGLTDAVDRAVISVVRDPEWAGPLGPLQAITELGSTPAIAVVALLVLAIGWLMHRPFDGIGAALAIAVGSIAISVLKRLFDRARPDLLEPVISESGFSFPSGHAANAMVAYGVTAVLVARLPLPLAARVGCQLVLAGVVFGVGLSRVWLGVHYPTDVLAGWLVGSIVVLVYAELTRPASPAPAAGAADADPAAPRSGRPAAD